MRVRVCRTSLIAAVAGLIGGLGGALIAQPAGRLTHPTAIGIASTAADALDVSGGAQFGSSDVALIGTDGKLNGPLSSTIIDDLSGANLTALNGANLTTATVGAAAIATDAVGSAEIAADAVGTSEIAADAVGSSEIAAGAVGSAEIATDAVGNAEIGVAAAIETALDTDTTATTNLTATWSDTGLSVTLNVDDATNDVTLLAWVNMEASGGTANCELRLVKGTTPTVLVTVNARTTYSAGRNPHTVLVAHEDLNPGSGNTTYKTQFRRSGTASGCETEKSSSMSVLWAYESQD